MHRHQLDLDEFAVLQAGRGSSRGSSRERHSQQAGRQAGRQAGTPLLLWITSSHRLGRGQRGWLAAGSRGQQGRRAGCSPLAAASHHDSPAHRHPPAQCQKEQQQAPAQQMHLEGQLDTRACSRAIPAPCCCDCCWCPACPKFRGLVPAMVCRLAVQPAAVVQPAVQRTSSIAYCMLALLIPGSLAQMGVASTTLPV